MEIMPITDLNGEAIGAGKPGMITRRLMNAYKDRVLRETRQ